MVPCALFGSALLEIPGEQRTQRRGNGGLSLQSLYLREKNCWDAGALAGVEAQVSAGPLGMQLYKSIIVYMLSLISSALCCKFQ